MKVSFTKQKNETGLSRMVQGPRGYDCKIDGVHVGQVLACRKPGATDKHNYVYLWWIRYNDAVQNSAAHNLYFETALEARDHMKRWITQNIQA